MQKVIQISDERHNKLFKKEGPKYKVPTSHYITGRELLKSGSPQQLAGSIPKIIHQTWKSMAMPVKWQEFFDGWSSHHPDFVHVLWTDADNDDLVRQHYPEFWEQYNWLPLVIQKTDFARLMYLHKYGGIYADLDFECHQNVVPHLPQLHGVMLVQSPYSFSEITQNSLMIAEPQHPFLYHVLQLIAEIIDDMRQPNSTKYPFNSLYKNVFVGKLLHTLSTLFITGPAALDKAFVRASLTAAPQDAVAILPQDVFFDGQVAKHHHNSSWFNGNKLLQVFFIVIAFSVIGLVLLCVLTTYFSTKTAYKKYKLQ